MSIYVDTSVLVALCTHEKESERIEKWFTHCTSELVTTPWSITEFASALNIKQRTRQITAEESGAAWELFQQLCSADITLLMIEPVEYHSAANLIIETKGLRAGDALHLTAAKKYHATHLATLDKVMAEYAKCLHLKNIF